MAHYRRQLHVDILAVSMPMNRVRLNVDATRLERARRLNLDLSIVFEAALADAIRRKKNATWVRRNGAALRAYNEHLEEHGVFSESLRSF